MARHALDGGGEVLRRYVQTIGIVAHLALSASDARGEQIHQLSDDISRAVGVRVGSVALGVRLEDVVHHRKAEAPHQLAVERQVALIHAVAETVEVGQDDVSIATENFSANYENIEGFCESDIWKK